MSRYSMLPVHFFATSPDCKPVVDLQPAATLSVSMADSSRLGSVVWFDISMIYQGYVAIGRQLLLRDPESQVLRAPAAVQ